MIKITTYDEKYKDDVINLILSIWEGEFDYKGLERPDIYDIPGFYQRNSCSNFWVALDDSELVGTAGLIGSEDGTAKLKRMAVKRGLRKSGLGERLLQTVVEFAQEKDIKTIYAGMVPENIAAIGFYKKHGFVENESVPDGLVIADKPVCLKLDL